MGLLSNSSRPRRRNGASATRFPLKFAAGLAVAACVLGVGLLLAAAAGISPELPFVGEGNGTGNGDAPSSEQQAGAETSSVVGVLPSGSVPVPQKEATDPRYAFLLLGYGGGGHEGAYLTDSIMVVIVDPSQKTLTMLSLPRDIWAPLIFDGKTAVYNKLNTAYAFAKDSSLYKNRLERYTGKNGAGRFTADTVSRLLGIPIANYLALDFQGFRQMIDAVGGVDVQVPASFSARYPANDDPRIDPTWITVRFTKGQEHMNGERAIRFARARDSLDNPAESNDFARSRRQRLIMEAFKNKVLSPGGLIHVPQLLVLASQRVDTDYSLPDAAQLGKLALEWKDMRIYQTALTLGNYLDEATGPGGAYILVPDEPNQSWERVRAFARRLWQDPVAGLAMADTKVTVKNDSGVNGVATKVTEILYRLGYRVNEPVSGTEQANSRLVDRTSGAGKALAPQLEKDLGCKLTLASSPGATGDLLLEVGSDDLDLANLKVAADSSAPTSAAGLLSVGGWKPLAPPTTQPPTPTRTVVAVASATGLAPTPTPGHTVVPPPPTATATPRSAQPTATRTPQPTATSKGNKPTPTPTRTSMPTATKPAATATPTKPAATATPTKPAATAALPVPSPTPKKNATATPQAMLPTPTTLSTTPTVQPTPTPT